MITYQAARVVMHMAGAAGIRPRVIYVVERTAAKSNAAATDIVNAGMDAGATVAVTRTVEVLIPQPPPYCYKPIEAAETAVKERTQ